MNAEQRMVKEFHELIGAPAPLRPMIPIWKRATLRLDLIEEELTELYHALGKEDLVLTADALGDLLVVVYGAALECGFDMEPIFREIHRSNMTKGDGGRREDGKALKGPSFTPPDLEPIIAAQSARDEWDDYPESFDNRDSDRIWREWIGQRDLGDETDNRCCAECVAVSPGIAYAGNTRNGCTCSHCSEHDNDVKPCDHAWGEAKIHSDLYHNRLAWTCELCGEEKYGPWRPVLGTTGSLGSSLDAVASSDPTRGKVSLETWPDPRSDQ